MRFDSNTCNFDEACACYNPAMLTTKPSRILVLAQDPVLGRHWAELLDSVAAGIWLDCEEVPSGTQIDVLVTDLPSLDEACRECQLPLRGDDPTQPADRALVGVVSMGSADWGDVNLPAVCGPSELRLACALLGEVIRLRRERHEILQAERQIRHLADTDPLTGLLNRRAWDREWPLRCALAASTGRPLSLALVDLDNFKQVNDSAGLVVGDRTLEHAARALESQLRQGDMIFRLGGDEFGVLLSDTSEQNADRVFNRLRTAVGAQQVEGGQQPVTASIGFAQTTTQNQSPGALFSAAEQALREAKQAGGDRVGRGQIAPGGA